MPLPHLEITDRDWVDDFKDEDNGCYGHICVDCKKPFMGHKRRPSVCYKCTLIAKAEWDALSKEEQERRAKESIEKIEEFVRNHKW